jgi:tetratricopeptide (TPR) repeat protein
VKFGDHGLCLTEETLTEYLDGALDPAIRAVSEVHLVSCSECRGRLAFLMHILQPEVTSEEANTLELIAAKWDKQTRRTGQGPFRFATLLVAFAAAVVLLVVGVVSVRLIKDRRPPDPQSANEVVKLLLSKQNRPFEARMTDEPYQPIVRTRGIEDPGVSYTLMAGEMTRLLANSHEMGRFYLLQKEFNRAIPYLEMAEREVGASAAVHNDLGVAYLESGNASQVEKAGPEFLHALGSDPSSVTAAFNLALFYERMNETAQSEARWKRYLELDHSSGWASEAQSKIQGISR